MAMSVKFQNSTTQSEHNESAFGWIATKGSMAGHIEIGSLAVIQALPHKPRGGGANENAYA
jgi:hypothetical protein